MFKATRFLIKRKKAKNLSNSLKFGQLFCGSGLDLHSLSGLEEKVESSKICLNHTMTI